MKECPYYIDSQGPGLTKQYILSKYTCLEVLQKKLPLIAQSLADAIEKPGSVMPSFHIMSPYGVCVMTLTDFTSREEKNIALITAYAKKIGAVGVVVSAVSRVDIGEKIQDHPQVNFGRKGSISPRGKHYEDCTPAIIASLTTEYYTELYARRFERTGSGIKWLDPGIMTTKKLPTGNSNPLINPWSTDESYLNCLDTSDYLFLDSLVEETIGTLRENHYINRLDLK